MKALFLGGSQHLKEKEVNGNSMRHTVVHVGGEAIDFSGEPSLTERPKTVDMEVYISKKMYFPTIYVLESLGNVDPSELFMNEFRKLLEEHNEKTEQTRGKNQAGESPKKESVEEGKSPAKHGK